MKKVLCVCLGNSDRSPVMAAVLGMYLKSAGHETEVQSAGTLEFCKKGGPDHRLGSDQLFTSIMIPAVIEARKGGATPFEAAKKYAPKNFISLILHGTRRLLLEEIIAEMEKKDVCVVPGHNPLIELFLEKVVGEELPDATDIKELDFVKLVLSCPYKIVSGEGLGLTF